MWGLCGPHTLLSLLLLNESPCCCCFVVTFFFARRELYTAVFHARRCYSYLHLHPFFVLSGTAAFIYHHSSPNPTHQYLFLRYGICELRFCFYLFFFVPFVQLVLRVAFLWHVLFLSALLGQCKWCSCSLRAIRGESAYIYTLSVWKTAGR